MFATAAMNVAGAAAFLPPARALRALVGWPEADHPLYLLTLSMFVLLFAAGYLWTALTARGDRLFIALAAVGKLAFFTLLGAFWIAGALPFRGVLAGTADLVFAVLFFRWLLGDHVPAAVEGQRPYRAPS